MILGKDKNLLKFRFCTNKVYIIDFLVIQGPHAKCFFDRKMMDLTKKLKLKVNFTFMTSFHACMRWVVVLYCQNVSGVFARQSIASPSIFLIPIMSVFITWGMSQFNFMRPLWVPIPLNFLLHPHPKPDVLFHILLKLFIVFFPTVLYCISRTCL